MLAGNAPEDADGVRKQLTVQGVMDPREAGDDSNSIVAERAQSMD
jgi:hypothetical protein